MDSAILQAIGTPGAISVAELLAIRWLMQAHYPQVQNSCAVDLGTCAGKAATAQLAGLRSTWCARIHLVDPAYGPERDGLEISSFPEGLRLNVVSRLQAVAPAVTVHLHGTTSLRFLANLDDRIGSVFIDSANHAEPMLTQECDFSEARAVCGALFVFHDFGNQFSQVKERYEALVRSGRFEPIDIPWDRFNEDAAELEAGNDSWHRYDGVKNPNFVGALKRK